MCNYSVKSFILEDGERYCVLIDKETSKPLFYPNMYLTAMVRNRAHSVTTMEAVAKNLGLLQSFLDSKDINVADRILAKKFLTTYEIDELIQHMGKSHSIRKVVHIKKVIKGTVKNQTKYSRVTTVSSYLKWLCEHLLTGDYECRDKSLKFIVSIKERRPKINNDNNFYTNEPKALDEEQIIKLFNNLKPGAELNPFSEDVQLRNELIITMLYSFGIRAGELLNLRISDFDFEKKTLRIIRRHDDKFDSRVSQPLVKTLNRDLFFDGWLEERIYKYIVNDRQSNIGENKHDFLFICHGKKSKSSGLPLTISAYEKIIMKIKSIDQVLNNFSGHQLRHTWNYDFSKEAEKSLDRDWKLNTEQVRSYLMGWSPNSETVKVYNQRFNKQQSDLMMKNIQLKIKRIIKGEKND